MTKVQRVDIRRRTLMNMHANLIYILPTSWTRVKSRDKHSRHEPVHGDTETDQKTPKRIGPN